MSISVIMHAAAAFILIIAENLCRKENVLYADLSLQLINRTETPPHSTSRELQPHESIHQPEHQEMIDNKNSTSENITTDTIEKVTAASQDQSVDFSVSPDTVRTCTASVKSGSIPSDFVKQHSEYIAVQFKVIRDMVYSHLSYPQTALDEEWEGTVKTCFIINKDGSIDSINISESSGFQILDANAIKTIKQCAPFPKSSVKVNIRLPVTYRLEY